MSKAEGESRKEKRPARKRPAARKAARDGISSVATVDAAEKTVGTTEKPADTTEKTEAKTAQAEKAILTADERAGKEAKTQLSLVRKLIEKISRDLTSKENAKGTLGDLLKLMQLEKELAPTEGRAKEIVVKWVAPWDK